MRLKRFLDVMVSGTALLVLLPLLLLIGALVWIDSGRPVFFAQERVGRGFRRFRIWKFRSMRQGICGPPVTSAGDRRVTRIGAILRATKLDELPQFWNVLRGDMSLVGPRPEMPEYVELYRQRYRAILSVRPGITDLASLAYRHEERILAEHPDPERYYREVVLQSKLILADEYMQHRSLWLDTRILVRTFVSAWKL